MFSDLVILYLFLGGAGAGLLVILSTLEALRFVGASSARWISATVWIPSAFFRMAWPVSFVILSMAILALIADLGRPDRLFAFVLHPRLSVMTIGAYALAIAWGFLRFSVSFRCSMARCGSTGYGLQCAPLALSADLLRAPIPVYCCKALLRSCFGRPLF